MKILLICLSVLIINTCCQQLDDDDGQYVPGKYLGPDGDDGQYIHDNSGQYVPDGSGLYKADKSGFYKHQLNKYRNSLSGGNFGGRGFPNNNNNFGNFGKRGKYGFTSSNNQLNDFDDNSENRKPASFKDQFVSSTLAPASRILHSKPLKGIKDVDFVRLSSKNFQNDFFGDSPSGTSFDPKTTHSALRTFPVRYNPGRYPSADGRWRIIKQNGDVGQDGYHWDYETENGIQAEETGKLENKGSNIEAMRAKGFYKYTGPDNKIYSVTYTADENGFIAEGNHLPTPPPIPTEILKSLNFPRGGPQRGKF